MKRPNRQTPNRLPSRQSNLWTDGIHRLQLHIIICKLYYVKPVTNHQQILNIISH